MSLVLSLIMAFSIGFTGASTQAPSDTPSQAPSQGLTQVLQAQAPHIPTLLTRCEEDMPCWDCKTMGNHICGPVQAPLDHITAPTVQAPKVVTASLKAPVKAAVKAPVKAPAKQTATAPKKAPKKATAPLITAPTAKGQTEAWKNFETNGFTEDELSKPFSVTYRGMIKQTSILPDGHEWYLVPSTTKGMDHVFELDFSAK
jgi:hypothetical protein